MSVICRIAKLENPDLKKVIMISFHFIATRACGLEAAYILTFELDMVVYKLIDGMNPIKMNMNMVKSRFK